MTYQVPKMPLEKYLAYCHGLMSERMPMLKTFPREIWDEHVRAFTAMNYPTAVVGKTDTRLADGGAWIATKIEFPTEAEVTMFVLKWGS